MSALVGCGLFTGVMFVPASAAIAADSTSVAGAEEAGKDVGDDVFAALGSVFEHTPGWAWLALFAGILCGLVAGKIVQMLLRRVGTTLHEQDRHARAIVFDALAGAVYLISLTLGIQFGLAGVRMPSDIAVFVQSVLMFLFTLGIGWFVYRMVDLVDVVLARHIEKANSKVAAQIAPLVRKAFRIFVVVIFVLFIAQNVFGVNISAWLAGLGIAGLAVSLASQDSVKNLFGSITVMLDKPFAVGDRIQFSGVDGMVEEIGFRSTRIRTFAGHLVTIPNMRFIDGTVENVSARPFIRRSLNVTITYDTAPEKIREAVTIIKGLLEESDLAVPFRPDERPPRVSFNDFNADSLNISVSYWYFLDAAKGHDWWGYLEHAQIFNHRLFEAFGAAGIEFAFPTQTLYLAGDPSRELMVRVAPNAEGHSN